MGAEGNRHRVIVGGGLQLKVERDAELLTERKSEGAIDACSVRCVHDELHRAGLIKEPFNNEIGLRRQIAQNVEAAREKGDGLIGRFGRNTRDGGQHVTGRSPVADRQRITDNVM